MQFSMQGIYEFAEIADLADVKEILDRQIQCNTAIAEEGLAHSYGANIGSVLLSTYGDSVQIRARALAAAGSDARMSGCELPVIINSGSGNQGMTCSLPVIAYARELQSSEEQLYRALLISNLSTLYQKNISVGYPLIVVQSVQVQAQVQGLHICWAEIMIISAMPLSMHSQ